MTILYKGAEFRSHATGAHPESPARLAAIDAMLSTSVLTAKCQAGTPVLIDLATLGATHAQAQIAAAKALASRGGGYLDPDTVVSPASFEVALRAAGTATAVVDEVMSGRHTNALCLIRPPGHHATKTQSMGFCLFNNVAVAAEHALRRHQLARILIVDFDVHHGNGTQDIFYAEENVVFFSIHRFPFYPGSGSAEETGTGKGLGATINVPVAFGTSRQLYGELFQRGLERAAQIARPDLILISAGFDAHQDDPVGNLGLLAEDYAGLTHSVRQVADTYCGGRIVSCLEGGYHLPALAASVAAHLAALL